MLLLGGPGSLFYHYGSSWGPTDDGRIKPDLVANGQSIYTATSSSTTSYETDGYGTSLSAPAISASIALLIEHQQNLYGGVYYRSSSTKALLLHTTDEAGANDGPDYSFGWGLANIKKAADLMQRDASDCFNVKEFVLNEGETIHIPVLKDTNSPLRATICWNDPFGNIPTPSLDPSDIILVNDLDLRITKENTTYYPWVLDKNNPSNPATTGDNIVDNVEQVVVNNSDEGTYFITISHKGNLQGGSQIVSLIISGEKEFSSTENLPNQSITSSVSEWTHGNFNVNGTTVEPGAKLELHAGNTISLKTGFHAKQNSNLIVTSNTSLQCTSGSFMRTGAGAPSRFVYERNYFSRDSDLSKRNLENDNIDLINDLLVYPNPSNGIVSIEYHGKAEPVHLTVFDLSGKVIIRDIMNQKAHTLDLSSLQKGVYFIKALNNEGWVIKKIILE